MWAFVTRRLSRSRLEALSQYGSIELRRGWKTSAWLLALVGTHRWLELQFPRTTTETRYSRKSLWSALVAGAEGLARRQLAAPPRTTATASSDGVS